VPCAWAPALLPRTSNVASRQDVFTLVMLPPPARDLADIYQMEHA
jgi:hypothetical protein